MKKRQKQLLYMFLGSALLLGAPERVVAEEAEAKVAEAEFNLDEYVVTASRMPTKVSETAANVTVIGRKEIEQKNLSTISEALTQAGVIVKTEGGSAGEESSIILNGDNRVVVLVDGRKINGEQRTSFSKSGYNLNELPNMNSVEKIEVVRGAASSLYGSNGVGGVINIITRKGAEPSSTVSTEFGSWGARRYSLQSSGKSGDTGYIFTFERQTQDNYEYKDPSTGKVVTMDNSDFSREKASVRIDKELGEGKTLTFYFNHLDEDANQTITKPGFVLYSPNASRHTIQNNVSLAYRWQQGENVTNNLQIYRNHSNFLWDRYKYNTYSSWYRTEADGIEWNQTRRLSDRHTLLGGFDWRNTQVDSKIYDAIPTGYDGKKIRNLGLFLEDRWAFDSLWTLTTGFRKDDSSEYDGASTVRLSLNRKVNDSTNAYLSWGQVYRGPDAVDLFLPDGSYYLSNPNLKPEKGDTVTLGINTTLSGGTAIQANVFSTHLKDALGTKVYSYASGMQMWQPYNIAEQKKQGFDLSITQPLAKHWDMTAGYSYLKVKEKNDDSGLGYQLDIANSNPNFYRLGFLYHNDAWNVNVMGRGATGRSLEAFTSRQYWVLDVAASYQIKPNIKVYAKVYNLTNRAYETTYAKDTAYLSDGSMAAGALPMSSRQFVFGVEGRM
ncbi:TonB-dependent siderophore receptor [Sporomusa sp. KB1]|jgi:vitamin B12 transporter|uniref:TonB-dependent receptor plug domain-containing protein n=1 Tax=Sporomusa sp. KB1 TaxID=943346 RepID=UPI0011A19822|nr:TonB-dependent receptor [Sporomusa sp. KB1]TWH46120.1 vitamin B12 transporter [Sporomusa sp. KB1]